MDHSTIPIYFVWIIRDINTIKYNVIFIKLTIPTYKSIDTLELTLVYMFVTINLWDI